MSRISRYEWAMGLAYVTSLRSTCARRQVGCVLLDIDGFVLSTGYNGVASGLPHCRQQDGHVVRCPGVSSLSGTNLDGCMAIHAEQNALIQCQDHRGIYAAVVTDSPCVHCVKMLMNTGCMEIVYWREYPHKEASVLWVDSFPVRYRRRFGIDADYMDACDCWQQCNPPVIPKALCPGQTTFPRPL